MGNIPAVAGMALSVYDDGSVFRFLYFGVEKGVYPPLIFLGIGAMTDFSTMLSNPKLVLLGAAAQIGVFLTYLGALTSTLQPRRQGQSESLAGPMAQRRSFFPPNSPELARCDCDRSVFLYGFRASDSASDHATSDDA